MPVTAEAIERAAHDLRDLEPITSEQADAVVLLLGTKDYPATLLQQSA